MAGPLKLMCILAHPDDESLGMGGILARYAAEGIETHLVTATRGERGRNRDGTRSLPIDELGRIREGELRAAAAVLGVSEVRFLDYLDQALDQADPAEALAKLVGHLRRVRPQVVVSFGPDGGYGHPDHVAISQFATAAVVLAADAGYAADPAVPAHRVAKLYYLAWSQAKWAAYQAAFKKLTSTVDGVERQATPWPDWAITTVVDTAAHWPTVWRAVTCHETQMTIYGPLRELSEEHHRGLWGTQEFYRALSLVNGGRRRESDLFEGLR
jgi:LmbE family N-acetylglucosaminyl deacetylase